MRVMDERGSAMDGRIRVIAVFAGLLLALFPAGADASPKPTHTSKSRFRIPFRFDSAALQRMNAREVQLHVSRDRGATWDLAQTLPVDGGKFDYQAAGNGEYWFSVKTLDGRDQLRPPRGSYETGLIVVVDNTPPTIEISLQQIGPGKLQLTWQAEDANLDANSVHAEFQPAGLKDWEPLPLASAGTGDTSWSVPQSGVVSVRASVADLAGNIGNATSQITVNANTGGGIKLRSHHRSPVAKIKREEAESALAKEQKDLTAGLPTIDSPQNAPQYDGPIITPQGSVPPYTPHTSIRNASTSRAESSEEKWPRGGVNVESIPFAPAQKEQSPLPPITSQPATQPPPAVAAEPVTQPRRAATKQRVVVTRRFQIGYELEEIGPSGIGTVEMFITENNGKKWWKYGDDADQKSPFDVEVPRDGVYGFAIRVRSGAGMAIDPPQPNEPPAIVVAVDQTAPIVELLPVQQGQGTHANRLTIRWKITEDNPSEKAVSIYYATTLNGPWEPISGWKDEPDSTFEWVAGPGVPTRFYIRVAARDAAGNVGKAETQSPIIVDRVQPSARIVDIEASPGPGPQ